MAGAGRGRCGALLRTGLAAVAADHGVSPGRPLRAGRRRRCRARPVPQRPVAARWRASCCADGHAHAQRHAVRPPTEQQAEALWPLRAMGARRGAGAAQRPPSGAGTGRSATWPPRCEVMRLAEITHRAARRGASRRRRRRHEVGARGDRGAPRRSPPCTRFAKVGAPPQARVLVVAPMSGHFATLLRDTVRTHAARPRRLRDRLAQRARRAAARRAASASTSTPST